MPEPGVPAEEVDETAEFFRRYFGPLDEDTIHIRALHKFTRRPREGWFSTPEEAAQFTLSLRGKYDSYFALSPRWDGKGDKAGVSRILGLWNDVDAYKLYDDGKQEAMDVLLGLELEP